MTDQKAPAPAQKPKAKGDWLEGRTLGKYKLVKRVGAGSFASIYEAVHVHLEVPFAIKVLHPAFASHDEIVKRFFREAQAASQLQHENVVFIADFDVAEGVGPYIVMEYLEGETLKSYLEHTQTPPLEKVGEISRQICQALTQAHRKGIIHRDLKPENVFLIRRDMGHLMVKVLDFGIAHLAAARESITGAKLMGTPVYMAPEQFRGQVNSESLDIYSFGVILYEMLVGQPPFQGQSVQRLGIEHLLLPAPELNESFPQALRQLQARLLGKSPEERPSSMEETWSLLAAALDPSHQHPHWHQSNLLPNKIMPLPSSDTLIARAPEPTSKLENEKPTDQLEGFHQTSIEILTTQEEENEASSHRSSEADLSDDSLDALDPRDSLDSLDSLPYEREKTNISFPPLQPALSPDSLESLESLDGLPFVNESDDASFAMLEQASLDNEEKTIRYRVEATQNTTPPLPEYPSPQDEEENIHYRVESTQAMPPPAQDFKDEEEATLQPTPGLQESALLTDSPSEAQPAVPSASGDELPEQEGFAEEVEVDNSKPPLSGPLLEEESKLAEGLNEEQEPETPEEPTPTEQEPSIDLEVNTEASDQTAPGTLSPPVDLTPLDDMDKTVRGQLSPLSQPPSHKTIPAEAPDACDLVTVPDPSVLVADDLDSLPPGLDEAEDANEVEPEDASEEEALLSHLSAEALPAVVSTSPNYLSDAEGLTGDLLDEHDRTTVGSPSHTALEPAQENATTSATLTPAQENATTSATLKPAQENEHNEPLLQPESNHTTVVGPAPSTPEKVSPPTQPASPIAPSPDPALAAPPTTPNRSVITPSSVAQASPSNNVLRTQQPSSAHQEFHSSDGITATQTLKRSKLQTLMRMSRREKRLLLIVWLGVLIAIVSLYFLIRAEMSNTKPPAPPQKRAQASINFSMSVLPRKERRRKRMQKVGIMTVPSGAVVYINEQQAGTTPLSTTLEAGKKVRLRFRKSGYQDGLLTHKVQKLKAGSDSVLFSMQKVSQ